MVEQADQPTLSARLPGFGLELRHIKSYSMASNFMTSTDAWTIELADYDEVRELQVEMHPIDLSIDGAVQVLGRIDSTEIGGNGLTMKLAGRDQIADLVECHVDPAIKLKKEMSLDTALLLACSPVGIQAVVYQDDIGLRNIRTGAQLGKPPSPAFKMAKLDEYKSHPGESVYAFCNRITARHGATIQPGIQRDQIVLSAPDYAQSPAFKLSRSFGPAGTHSNTILSATAQRDLSSFPTHVLATGKTGKAGLARVPTSSSRQAFAGSGDVAASAKPYGESFDMTPFVGARDAGIIVGGRRKPASPAGAIAPALYRLHYLRDEDARTQAQLEKTTLRLVADRLKDSLRYEVVVRGFRNSGRLWAVDTLVSVSDELCGVHEDLWIEGRTFAYDAGQGPTTRLTCWRPGAFVI